MKNKKTILIVDDEPSNIEYIASLLNDKYNLAIATNGLKGLQILQKRENIDLILLDINMPQMDGFEMAEKLKSNEQTKNIPILFLTAHKNDQIIEKAYKYYYAADYLIKPVRGVELFARVEKELKISELIYDLKTKVQEEVDKNTEKNRLIMQQSKMAEFGNMIGVIGHQWKQPLNNISLITQSMRIYKDNGVLTDEKFDKSIDKMKEQVSFMTETINSFKNYFDPNKSTSKFSPFEVVNDTFKLLEAKMKFLNIDIVFDGDKDILVYGDQNELKQVVLNILNNAIDVLEDKKVDKPKLIIQLTKDHDSIVLLFKDNGGGIPKDLLPNKIFESYFTTKGEDGTGIGLHISKKIVTETFGGKIEAFNEDDCAVFTITIPFLKEG